MVTVAAEALALLMVLFRSTPESKGEEKAVIGSHEGILEHTSIPETGAGQSLQEMSFFFFFNWTETNIFLTFPQTKSTIATQHIGHYFQ